MRTLAMNLSSRLKPFGGSGSSKTALTFVQSASAKVTKHSSAKTKVYIESRILGVNVRANDSTKANRLLFHSQRHPSGDEKMSCLSAGVFFSPVANDIYFNDVLDQNEKKINKKRTVLLSIVLQT